MPQQANPSRGYRRRGLLITATAAVGALVVGSAAAASLADDVPHVVDPTLRQAAPEKFRIGTAAAGGGHHTDADYPEPFPNDELYREIIATEFSSLTPENQMKWEFLRPDRDTYNFGPADEIVDFADEHGQVVRGHTLLWHSQNPEWLENGDFSAEELREILREHITTVVGHYAGRIQHWEVANEVIDDSGNLRTQDNIWIRELGPEIIADAFRWAHAADPQARLFFNDYNAEGINAKTDAYYELISELLDDGVPVHGFGAQAHLSLQYGFDTSLEENLQRFADLGLETAITEADVRIPLGDDGEPSEDQLAEQARRFGLLLEACLNVDTCNSFTLWGINDMHSWVPGTFPGEGAANIMWEDYSLKPAHHTLLETLVAYGAPPEPAPRYGFFLTNDWSGGVADHAFMYGRHTDEVLIGDWDGDGSDTITVRRGNAYHVNNALQGGPAASVFHYGRADDVVLVGDWDGDQVDTLAVRRGSVYYVNNSLRGGDADHVIGYGRSDDDVLVGDWNDDGRDTFAVRRGATYFVRNHLSAGPADVVFTYGRHGDVVLAGDWDGDGYDTLAVRRGKEYHVKNSLRGGPADLVMVYGRASDAVYVGDWDGDGRDTIGVRRTP